AAAGGAARPVRRLPPARRRPRPGGERNSYPHELIPKLPIARMPYRRVVVDVRKIRDYCLSAEHPRGRHKARVFQSRLGVWKSDAQLLRQALLTAVVERRNELRSV